jgi:hypothetical protein
MPCSLRLSPSTGTAMIRSNSPVLLTTRISRNPFIAQSAQSFGTTVLHLLLPLLVPAYKVKMFLQIHSSPFDLRCGPLQYWDALPFGDVYGRRHSSQPPFPKLLSDSPPDVCLVGKGPGKSHRSQLAGRGQNVREVFIPRATANNSCSATPRPRASAFSFGTEGVRTSAFWIRFTVDWAMPPREAFATSAPESLLSRIILLTNSARDSPIKSLI